MSKPIYPKTIMILPRVITRRQRRIIMAVELVFVWGAVGAAVWFLTK